MAFTFCMDRILEELASMSDEPEDYMLPDEIDRSQFALFLRIMEAKTPDNIKDVPTEDIIQLFPYLKQYSGCIQEREGSILDKDSIRNLKKVPSALHRRVL